MEKITIEQHLSDGRTLVDVRSPCEFARARISYAINIPLFTDLERQTVGIEYKKMGKRSAIERGLELVDFPRILSEIRQAGLPPAVDVYCARGGMRSASMAWLLELLGYQVRTIEGGYKFFRRWALSYLSSPYILVVLGGETGSGKTKVLQELQKTGENVIDLEKLAHHRGSVFGDMDPQPTQEQFENEIALQLYRRHDGMIWVEDESKRIGALKIPDQFFERMQKSRLIVLQVPHENRVQHCLDEYLPLGEKKLSIAIHRLQRRLGGQESQNALTALEKKDYPECCRILLRYYDKKYRYGIGLRSSENVVYFNADKPFQGVIEELKNPVIRLF